jgi:hypothetical protein
MVVLLITLIAFGDSFLTLSLGNKDGEQFVDSFGDAIIYTYRIVLGDFDVEHFGSVATGLVYGLFILCTVFNTIVMLNLLIAIISESFSYVKENAENASYQEMASMIAENTYLIPQHIKVSYAEDNRYLLVVSDREIEHENDNDEVVRVIEHMKRKLFTKVEKISINLKQLSQASVAQKAFIEKQE